MTRLPPESLERLRAALAGRADVERVVHLERRIEPSSEPAFDEHRLVVVPVELLDEPCPWEWTAALTALLRPALDALAPNVSIVVPSRAGLQPLLAEGGDVLYERRGA